MLLRAASTGSNIHALIEGMCHEAGPAQAAWAALEEASHMPRKTTRLLPLATRTPAGLQALADAIMTCPGALHALVSCACAGL